jgi:homocysteine S-methyltransferase
VDLGANPIGSATQFVIGVGANPGISDVDEEVRRFEYKCEAGAHFAVTQPVFDMRLLEQFLRRVEHCRIPVMAGIWPLTSVRNAEFMRNELRVSVPDEIMARMAAASSNSEHARAEGVLIAREMLLQARGMVQGVQVSAPLGKFAAAVDVIEALGQRVEGSQG